MKYVYLYVCDGDVPSCEKTACHWNGNGDCRHTSDSGHARYPEPHVWAMEMKEPKRHTFFERVREDGEELRHLHPQS